MASKSTEKPQFHQSVVYIEGHNVYSQRRSAWVSISSCIRWIYTESRNDPAPTGLLSFRGHDCLTPEKLTSSTSWSTVESTVYAGQSENRASVVVTGILSPCRKTRFKPERVELTIVVDDVHVRDSLLQIFRFRVAPWQLLHRHLKANVLDSPLTISELQNILELVERRDGKGDGVGCSIPTGESSKKENLIGSTLNGSNTILTFVGALASIIHLSSPVISETAKLVASVAKCATIGHSAFQVVALFRTVVEMASEAKRGKTALPAIRTRLSELDKNISKCMVPMLHPGGNVNEMHLKELFQVQDKIWTVLRETEEQIMRPRYRQFLASPELKSIETSLSELEQAVRSVLHSSHIADISITLKSISNGRSQNIKLRIWSKFCFPTVKGLGCVSKLPAELASANCEYSNVIGAYNQLVKILYPQKCSCFL